jgi:VWFA-related protein
MNRSLRMWIFLLCLPVAVLSQQGAVPGETPAQSAPSSSSPKDPALVLRPPPGPQDTRGRILLDVVVTGKQGTPVPGLELKDFTILDEKKVQDILSFAEVDGTSGATDRPVQVILLLDLVNSTFEQSSVARAQIGKFLQQNDGHLAYPTSIMVLAREGLRIQHRPSTDGNALLALLGQANTTAASAALGEGERFQLSVRSLASIAENEVKSPGRKILIWTGPGWPMMAGARYGSTSQDRQRAFDTIVEISTRMREAHIAVYSISPMADPKAGTPGVVSQPHGGIMPAGEAGGQSRTGPILSDTAEGASYKEFIHGVKSARQADTGNLALQVIAVESGGRVLDPSNDLAAQIDRCVQDVSVFYTISFNPAHADHADEYHDLKVQIAKPGLTARTTTGYYNQP